MDMNTIQEIKVFNSVAAEAEQICAEGDIYTAAEVLNRASQRLLDSEGIKADWEIRNEVLRVKYL